MDKWYQIDISPSLSSSSGPLPPWYVWACIIGCCSVTCITCGRGSCHRIMPPNHATESGRRIVPPNHAIGISCSSLPLFSIRLFSTAFYCLCKLFPYSPSILLLLLLLFFLCLSGSLFAVLQEYTSNLTVLDPSCGWFSPRQMSHAS